MCYRRAEDILPMELIEMIQQYVGGENIYIPRKAESRREWGSSTRIREELEQRNESICADQAAGMKVPELAEKYYLSEKSIQRIIREQKE